MDIKAINTYLKQPELLTTQDLPLLEYIIDKFPYFQAARAIQLKILKDNGSYLYNQRLKETAAYTTSRDVLFDFITSPLFTKTEALNQNTNDQEIYTTEEFPEENKTEIDGEIENVYSTRNQKDHLEDRIEYDTEDITEKNSVNPNKIDVDAAELNNTISSEVPDSQLSEEEATLINDPALFQPKENTDETQKDTPISEIAFTQQPLDFNKDEIHSFNEWLQLSHLKVVHKSSSLTTTDKESSLEKKNTSEISLETAQPPSKKKKITSELIDKFIESSPKIAPLKKVDHAVNLAKLNNTAPNDLMTETLAKVYLAQNNYKKAIQAYKILSLKNPEKSGFFADQIRKIEKLQANK